MSAARRSAERLAFERAVVETYTWWPPIAARIFAYLITADDLVSTAELTSALGVSPGSISTLSRWLIEQGVVVRRKQPGRRGDFYECVIDARAVLNQIMSNVRNVAALADAMPSDLAPAAEKRFLDFFGVAATVAERIEPLLTVDHLSTRRARRTQVKKTS